MAGDEILELDVDAANVHGMVEVVRFKGWVDFLFVEKEWFADFFGALASRAGLWVEEVEVKGEKLVEMLLVLVEVDACDRRIFKDLKHFGLV